MRKNVPFFIFLILIIFISDSHSNDLFESLRKIFQFKNTNYFTTNYDIRSLKLIYPSNLEKIKDMRRCVLSAKIMNGNTMAALKLEQFNTTRSVTNQKTQELKCNRDVDSIPTNFRVPTEHFMNTLMNDESNFNKYYPQLSGILKTQTQDLIIYVSEFKEGSMDLQEWANKNRNRLKTTEEFEEKIRTFYRKIHGSLMTLKEYSYIYTDFKPQNVLIDNKMMAYLIDLESVIKASSKKPCLTTTFYSEPKKKIKTPDEIEYIHNRILCWTFCFSTYESMCFRINDDYNAVAKKLESWDKNIPFMNHFGCRVLKLSNSFKEFINTCLTEKISKDSFSKLSRTRWLRKDIKMNVTLKTLK